MSNIRRRDFLKILTGASSFGLAYSYGLFPNIVEGEALAKQMADYSLRPPEDKWVTSICRQCSGGCGILVRVYGDRAVKIDGNPLHPINRGKLCARGQSGLQLLYDPDRIKGPMLRVGERGEGKWKQISWDEALRSAGDKLKELRKKGKSNSVVMLTGAQEQLAQSVSERFMEVYGSPNLIRYSSGHAVTGMIPGVNMMQGSEAGVVYDIENSSLILSFNSGLLETPWSPVQTFRAFGEFRRSQDDIRGKFVQIEPRLSVTGAKADKWVPIRPGTEGILALGIASMLVLERNYDEDFMANRTFGFEDWTDKKGVLHPGFKTMLIQEYPIDKVVRETGVPRDSIISLARDFARHQPALAIGNDNDGVGNPGIYNRMAIHALNALVGSIQKTGGVLTRAKTPDISLPSFSVDAISAAGLSKPRIDGAGNGMYSMAQDVPARLFEQIKRKQPYSVEAILLNGANPVFDSHDPELFLSAIKQVPTIISFSSFMDETSQYADLILPDSTYLEKWQLDSTHTLKGNSVVSIGRPVLAPVYDTRDSSETLISLSAKAIGKSASSAFPSTKSQDLVKASIKKLHNAGRGEPFGAPLEEVWTKLLERSGWKVRSHEQFEKFWEKTQEQGGWWDPVYYQWEWKRVLATPSGKFEFYSLAASKYISKLKGMEKDLALKQATEMIHVDKSDVVCMPHGAPGTLQGNESIYNLELNPYFIPILSGLSHTNQAWLQDITGFHVYQNWHTWVEINPETAHKAGLKNGDSVWVESLQGKITAKVRIYNGVMPDVINLPVGLGHKSGGRWTKGIGENVLQLLPYEKELFTGEVRFTRCRARLIKATV